MSKVAYEAAKVAFNRYAAMDAPKEPETDPFTGILPRLQVRLSRWVQNKVPKHTLPPSVENVLGASEELGELAEAIGKLAHYELNISQGRRYQHLEVEELRAKKADAIADICVFLMNLCTAERLDFGELFITTVLEVVERDWNKNPSGYVPIDVAQQGPDGKAKEVRGWSSKIPSDPNAHNPVFREPAQNPAWTCKCGRFTFDIKDGPNPAEHWESRSVGGGWAGYEDELVWHTPENCLPETEWWKRKLRITKLYGVGVDTLTRIRAQTGDTLVFQTARRLSEQTVDSMTKSIKALFPDQKVLIVDDGLSLKGLIGKEE